MGGTFLQVAGEVKYHVMPDFSPCPLDSDEKVSQWLRFYTFGAPFVNMATFISKDPGNVSIYSDSCSFFSNWVFYPKVGLYKVTGVTEVIFETWLKGLTIMKFIMK